MFWQHNQLYESTSIVSFMDPFQIYVSISKSAQDFKQRFTNDVLFWQPSGSPDPEANQCVSNLAHFKFTTPTFNLSARPLPKSKASRCSCRAFPKECAPSSRSQFSRGLGTKTLSRVFRAIPAIFNHCKSELWSVEWFPEGNTSILSIIMCFKINALPQKPSRGSRQAAWCWLYLKSWECLTKISKSWSKVWGVLHKT